MNKIILIGRLCKDVETKYSGETAISRYTLAVDRRYKKDGEQTADFISCVAFGKNGEFAKKYLKKGMKIAVIGRIQTGSYTNKENQKVYTTDIIVEEHEFCESKGSGANGNNQEAALNTDENGFMDIPDDIDADLPFS